MKTVASFFIFLSIIIINGCKDRDIIEEDKFVKVYSDLLIASDSTSLDSAKTAVFKKYSISFEKYQKTVDRYNSSPAEWEAFFSKVIAYIEEAKKDSSSAL